MPNLPRMLLPLALTLSLCAVLSSCGRKGDLDPPSVAAQQQDKFGKKNTQAPPQPNKPFLLDPLL